MLTFTQIKERGLGSLFKDGISAQQQTKAAYLVRHHSAQLMPEDVTHQFRREDGTFAPSFLHLLSFDVMQWTLFFSNKTEARTREILKCSFAWQTLEGNAQNTPILLSLIKSSEEWDWIYNNIKIIAPLLTPEILFTPLIDEGPHKGRTLFYFLCVRLEGQYCLYMHWNDFKKHLSAQGLFAPVIGEGADTGVTPFYYLCVSKQGRLLLRKYWNDIKPHLNAEGLYAPVTGKVSYQGASPVSVLEQTEDGKEILALIHSELSKPECLVPKKESALARLGLFAKKPVNSSDPTPDLVAAQQAGAPNVLSTFTFSGALEVPL